MEEQEEMACEDWGFQFNNMETRTQWEAQCKA
jgi:hypothetical protein